MWLFAGLGNPGESYAKTRHNAGFMVLDHLASMLKSNWQKGFQSLYCKSHLNNKQEALLLKPQTFMNLSGQAAHECANFYKIPISKVIVIHDELDLDFGIVRVKVGGGHGGHNGLKNLIQYLGADFIRVRVGIGKPKNSNMDTANYVLSAYAKHEIVELEHQIVTAMGALMDITQHGAAHAQSIYNQKQPLA